MSQFSRAPFVRGTEILPGVHQIPGIGARSLVIEGAHLTVVDAGLPGSARRIERYLDALGWRLADVDLIVVSHYHLDHVGGLAELRAATGAPVAAHASEAGILRGDEGAPSPFGAPLLHQVFEPLRQLVAATPIPVDVALEDGDELPGHPDVRVVHAPGHTRGQIALHAARDRWLFVADALQVHWGRLCPPSRFFTEDMALAYETIDRLSRIDVDWLFFSHFRPRRSDGVELRDLAERLRLERLAS